MQPTPAPPNRPPVATTAIPAQTIPVGETAAIYLSDHFSDPDGDTLSFWVEVSDEAVVVGASVSANTLAVLAFRPGTVSMTVTAQDPGGLMASQHVDVTVPNQAPILTDSIAALELFTFDSVTINLRAHFTDPDGDALSFAAETTNRKVATVSLSAHMATVTANGSGTADITVAGTDREALTASQTFVVTVPNRQPAVTEPIPRQPVLPGRSTTIDLLDHFGDPDGDALEFTALTSDDAVAAAATSGTRVSVASVGPGRAEITVIARDPGDLSTAQSFVVNVPANADRDALIALHEATDGPNWDVRTNWLSNAPLGSWAGVSVNADGRVNGVQLGHNGLAGHIPRELGWLTELTHLDLSGNNLKRHIPAELGRLRALQHLNLRGNSLTGAIPEELGELAALTSLHLSFNVLTATIPPGLGALADLEILDLGGNRLTGPIPASLGNLSQLETLLLQENNLTGSIPPELSRLGNLVDLWLFQNRLEGAVPTELGKLRSLEQLVLGSNNLTGSIPPTLGQLHDLERLSLRFNKLTGPIPAELGGMAALETLYLDHNRLTDSIPTEFGGLRNLEVLWLHENLLTSPLPTTVGNLQNLRSLTTYGNDGLCIPGVVAFAVLAEQRPEADLCNAADKAALTTLFESTGGSDWTDSQGWLLGPLLERWQRVVTDSVGRVLELDLRNNGLAGRLPSVFGDRLDRLSVLRIGDNALSGPLPASLVDLPLKEFDYADTGLCVPRDEAFKTWLDGISIRRGPLEECPMLSDRDILVRLYEATDGEKWVESENWLTDTPLGSWFGVSTDADGRVTGIDLGGNGLVGRLPPELGSLAELRDLSLRSNGLAGTIPLELGSLASLEILRLTSNELSGRIPPSLGNLSELRRLGLSDNLLTGSIPSELGRLGQLNFLSLGINRLTGRIPAQLGNLAALEDLTLEANQLRGPIPPELGNLSALEHISLRMNQLSGPIPAEFGRLAKLASVNLSESGVAGPIPPELANLTNLYFLNLLDNELTGTIPPGLGALANLESLLLSYNSLTGPIPAELGMLRRAVHVWLADNDLSGPLPVEIGNLTGLKWLDLSSNAGLGGPLPSRLTRLGRLRELDLTRTGLCVADDPNLSYWLRGVGVEAVARCAREAKAYLTQAVQSLEHPVPLVAGEKALLRVFVTATRVNQESFPPVRATFFVDGREVYRTEISGRDRTIPTRVDESSLENSANALVPGSVVQPGLEMVIEVQPDGDLDPSLGVDRRIPKAGRLALDVSAMPRFDLTLIPFLWSEDPDSTIIDATRAMAADPETHELLWDTRTLLPVSELSVTAHEPVWSSDNNSWRLFDQTEAIRAMEGGQAHYMGMLAGEHRGPRGLGYAPGEVSFSIPDAAVIAHELGHNMDLLHAPCGRPKSLDPGFPKVDGSVGAWGYDFRDGRGLVDPLTSDLMSYCDPHWISGFGFTTALHYRLQTGEPGAAVSASPSKSLLVWGGIDADGNPYLEPTFVVEAPPRLPVVGTDYLLEGRDTEGAELFSLTFDIPAVADGEGVGAFAFVVPTRPGWENALASVYLSGPTGTATLSAHNEDPMAILLDPRSGRVRGFLRSPSGDPRIQPTAADGGSAQRGFEVLFSRGIPDAAEWRR